jgi:acyl-CoA thioesterase I
MHRTILLAPLVTLLSCGASDAAQPDLVPPDVPFSSLAVQPASLATPSAARPAQPAAPSAPPPAPSHARLAAGAMVTLPPDFVALLAHRLGRLPPKRPGVPRVAFVGDSLTFGWGVTSDAAYPEVLARRLREEGRPIEVINGGIPGVTSGTVREHFAVLAPTRPDIVVLALGANDYLFNFPLDALLDNLRAIAAAGRDMGARVLLVGIHLTRAFSSTQRGQAFETLYPSLAAELDVPLVPDLLEDALGQPRFMQQDEIHPTVEGHLVLADNVLPQLRALIAVR